MGHKCCNGVHADQQTSLLQEAVLADGSMQLHALLDAGPSRCTAGVAFASVKPATKADAHSQDFCDAFYMEAMTTAQP